MAESMLAILCHILRGEPVIQERLSKEREGTSRAEEDGGSAAGGASGGTGTVAVGESATGSGGGTGTAGATADDGNSSTARREPQVNQAQLTQVTCPLFPWLKAFTLGADHCLVFTSCNVLLFSTENKANSKLKFGKNKSNKMFRLTFHQQIKCKFILIISVVSFGLCIKASLFIKFSY